MPDSKKVWGKIVGHWAGAALLATLVTYAWLFRHPPFRMVLLAFGLALVFAGLPSVVMIVRWRKAGTRPGVVGYVLVYLLALMAPASLTVWLTTALRVL